MNDAVDPATVDCRAGADILRVLKQNARRQPQRALPKLFERIWRFRQFVNRVRCAGCDARALRLPTRMAAQHRRNREPTEQ